MIAALTSANACYEETNFTPNANTIIVEAVIDAGQRNQDVMVQYTDGLIRDQYYVGDATVTMDAPDGTVLRADVMKDTVTINAVPRPKQVPRTFYRISLDKYHHSVVPGGTYRLHVSVPGRPEVTAVTTVPVAVLIPFDSTVVGDFDRGRDTITFSWPAANAARMHQVVIGRNGQRIAAFFAEKSLQVAGTSGVDRDGGVRTALFAPGEIYEALVIAVDDHYYNYFRLTSIAAGQPVMTGQLNGAVGVFGSIAPVSRQRFLVR